MDLYDVLYGRRGGSCRKAAARWRKRPLRQSEAHSAECEQALPLRVSCWSMRAAASSSHRNAGMQSGRLRYIRSTGSPGLRRRDLTSTNAQSLGAGCSHRQRSGLLGLAIAVLNLLPIPYLDGSLAWQLLPLLFRQTRSRQARRGNKWRPLR